MILADTSVWIHFFRDGDDEFERLLEDGEIAMHPMVLGELACGNLARRDTTMHLLNALPCCDAAPNVLVLQAIETRRWFRSGVGWVDAHLLTSALLSQTLLWTLDARLDKIAQAAHVSYDG